jgi:hypothetical protein
MANSYNLYTANGSTTDFSLVGIDGWISSGFLKVYVNDTLQTTGYSFQDLSTAAPFVRFTTAPANLAQVRLQRETPNTVASFQANVVDFNDGSVLTASDLDKVVTGLVHVAQEAEDTGSGALGLTVDETNWDADSKRITNMDDGINAQDAVTMNQLTTATIYGGATVIPQVWYFNGNGTTTYTLNPLPLNTTREMFLVEVGGVLQQPNTYSITKEAIIFNGEFASTIGISVRNFGVSRNVIDGVNTSTLQDGSVTTPKIADLNVTTAKIANSGVTTAKIADDAVTYAKMQNVSATDKVLGRSTAGAGNVEEIACTSAGRDMIAATDASAQRNLLSLGSLAVKSTVSNDDIAAGTIGLNKLQSLDAFKLVGTGAATGAPIALSSTGFGQALIQASSTATFRNQVTMYNATATNFIGLGNASVLTSAAPLAADMILGRWANFRFTTNLNVASIGVLNQTWLCFVVPAAGGNFGVGLITPTTVLKTPIEVAAACNCPTDSGSYAFCCIRVA